MKKTILLPFALATSVALFACNSGGGSSGSQVSLPAGNYLGTMTNISPAGCTDSESDIYTSNGTGQVCTAGICGNLNLSANPCMSVTATQSGVTGTETWQNCNYTSGVLTAMMNAVYSQGGQTYTCTANIQLAPIAQ